MIKATPISTIEGLYILKPQEYHDERGHFKEMFKVKGLEWSDQLNYGHLKLPDLKEIKQVNLSESKANVLRGMHEAPFKKIVTCLKGCIYDMVADTNEKSPTYGKCWGKILTDESKEQILVPANCSHGFYAIKDSVVLYAQDGLYNPELEKSYHWKSFNFNWPFVQSPILSEKDEGAPAFV